MSDELLTVIIPCYNEAGNIEKTVASVQETLADLPLRSEVFLVDDCSTDNTVACMEELAKRYDNIVVHKMEKNLGVGRVVLKMYEIIDEASWVTVMPGDNEIIFSSIKNHLAIRDQSDLVLGYFQNAVIRPFRRRMASYAFTLFSRVFYGFHYRYLNGQKLYRASIFKGIDVVSSGHGFNAELIAKAILRKPDLRITEAPFLSRGRQFGTSKAFKWSSIFRAFREFFSGFRSVSKYREATIRKGIES